VTYGPEFDAPPGQRAATGGKVATSGPLYGTNAASRHVYRTDELLSSSRMQMYGVTSGPAVQSRPRRLPLALTPIILFFSDPMPRYPIPRGTLPAVAQNTRGWEHYAIFD